MIKRFLALILALCALWIGASAEEILVEDGLVLTEDYEIEYGVYTDLVMEYIISKAITE